MTTLGALTVIGANGQVTPGVTERQHALLKAATTLIQAAPEFHHLVHPVLSRAEVNAGLEETQRGYLYLRYDVTGSVPQEFWAHVGKTAHLNWKTGQLGVPVTPNEASPPSAGQTESDGAAS